MISWSLDDAQKPQDEDQDQETAKTDIHFNSSRFVLLVKRWTSGLRSSRYGSVKKLRGIILPVRKTPDLLDFPEIYRN